MTDLVAKVHGGEAWLMWPAAAAPPRMAVELRTPRGDVIARITRAADGASLVQAAKARKVWQRIELGFATGTNPKAAWRTRDGAPVPENWRQSQADDSGGVAYTIEIPLPEQPAREICAFTFEGDGWALISRVTFTPTQTDWPR